MQDQRRDDERAERSRWAEFREVVGDLAEHLWDEATDRRNVWPPTWLVYAAVSAAVLLVAFIVLPLLSALIGWLTGTGMDGVTWLAGWDLSTVVTGPVRSYLSEYSPALGVPVDLLWTVWLFGAGAMLLLSIIGSAGARIAWVLLGVGTAAMVWSQSPRPGQWLAVGITAAWWALLSLAALRRIAPQGTVAVPFSLPKPRLTPAEAANPPVTVGLLDLRQALRVLDDLATVLDTAALAARESDPKTYNGAAEQASAAQARLVRGIREQLADESTPGWDHPYAGAGYAELCLALDQVPLVHTAERHPR